MAENKHIETRLGEAITGDMIADVMSGTRRIDLSDLEAAVEVLSDIDIPAELRDNLALFLRLERRVLREYDPAVLDTFDELMMNVIRANAGDPGAEADGEDVDEQGMPASSTSSAEAFRDAIALIDALPVDRAQVIVRAFTAFFHLANLSEESYRVGILRERERNVSTEDAVDPANALTVAFHQLTEEVGGAKATELLSRLEFHPVFTAHPTEARRKAVEGKIRRIADLLEDAPPGRLRLGGERAPHAAGDRRPGAHEPHRAQKAHARRRGRHHHRHLRQHAVRHHSCGVPQV